MAEHVHSTTAPCQIGHHPRRTDHPALLSADGELVTTFVYNATRAEITEALSNGGLVLHVNDTVTKVEPEPSRRRLLSAAVGAAFAGAALVIAAPTGAQPAGDDAELLAALGEFDALELRMFPPDFHAATIEEEHARDKRVAPLLAEQEALLDQICALRAVTPEGWRARARSLLAWDNEMSKSIAEIHDPERYMDERMIAALVRDLAGEPVA